MALVIHNTLNGKKEEFTPIEAGKVKIYVCGPTVYDNSHIGHARAVVVFDVLVKHLKDSGYEVTYVRNFTDVDDKIINRANENGEDYLEVAEKFIKSFHEDMDALGAARPDIEPRATNYINEMIADIQSLVESGHAYQAGGDVYYDVTSFDKYGSLSGRTLEDMKAGARIEVDERKHSPWDFALWKESKPGEPSWPSPWGNGRPGWHIECSAMSYNLLGAEFDIHGGGHDLVFPHHENELAQSAALDRSFARYWMHNGFVRVDHQKMSKSLKNFFTIKEVMEKFDSEVIRLFLVSKHYRSPIDFTDEALKETNRSLDKAYLALRGADDLGVAPDKPIEGPAGEMLDLFREAMDDDLNTAKALGRFFEAVRELNRLIDEARTAGPDLDVMGAWYAAIKIMGATLGILNRAPAEWFEREAAAASGEGDDAGPSVEKIEEMVTARTEARAAKNWAEADRIRDELKSWGVVLEDGGGQTRWRMES